MRSAVTVRPAGISDLDAMTGLLWQLFSIETDFTPDEEKQQRGLQRLLDVPDAQVAVAEVAGRVIGMATVQTLVSTAEGGRVGLVEDVVVDRVHRGKGVGSALLDYLQVWAAENSLSRLQLAADCGNDAALEFYQGRGWKQTRLVIMRAGD